MTGFTGNGTSCSQSNNFYIALPYSIALFVYDADIETNRKPKLCNAATTGAYF